MNLEFIKFTGEHLPDFYTLLIAYKIKMGEHEVKQMAVGIHMFNTQEFMSAGKVIPRDSVIAYAHYNINELDKL